MCSDAGIQERVKLMGIINVTPDSFYAPSRYNLDIFDSGADIIDIGACSTRPGSEPVSEEEEWDRLEPVLWDISRHHMGPEYSLDTFRSGIVRRALRYLGRFIVNDVTAGSEDDELLPLVASLGLPYVAMHGWAEHRSGARHRHRTAFPSVLSGRNPDPEAIVDEVFAFFEQFSARLDALGIRDWYLDPGFGFGKTTAQNLALLRGLPRFKAFGRPVLVGISRKRMTWEPLGLTPGTALEETSRLQALAIGGGASVLRVHDVAAARELL